MFLKETIWAAITKHFQVFECLIEQGNDPAPSALTTYDGGQTSCLLAKSWRGYIISSVPLMVTIGAQSYSWTLCFTSGHIYSHTRRGYMPFVLLQLIDCHIVSSFPLLHQIALQFHMVASATAKHNLVTDAMRGALQCSPCSPRVQLSLASLWSTGINTDY